MLVNTLSDYKMNTFICIYTHTYIFLRRNFTYRTQIKRKQLLNLKIKKNNAIIIYNHTIQKQLLLTLSLPFFPSGTCIYHGAYHTAYIVFEQHLFHLRFKNFPRPLKYVESIIFHEMRDIINYTCISKSELVPFFFTTLSFVVMHSLSYKSEYMSLLLSAGKFPINRNARSKDVTTFNLIVAIEFISRKTVSVFICSNTIQHFQIRLLLGF